MSIEVGDKVRFLNDVGGGEVVSIISKNQVLVRNESDFEYPYPTNELVVIEKHVATKVSNTELQSEPKLQKVEKRKIEPIYKDEDETEILLAFTKNKDPEKDSFDCHLINDSNYSLFYHAVLRADVGFEKIDSEILEPNTKICIGELERLQINTSKELIVQILFFDHPHDVLHNMLERRIKIVPIKFFQEHVFVENDFLDDKAYVFELLTEKFGLGESMVSAVDFENNIAQKDSILEEDKSKRYKPRKQPKTVEVDLHINQLVDSVIGMSNAEILKLQMDTFHKAITNALLDNDVAKIVLIHGIGNGTLKDSIRESLEKQYKLHFEDASFREYGFGATEVIL